MNLLFALCLIATPVYLTFDDGPHKNTDKVLDILKEKHVKATFFLVGERLAYYPHTVERIVAEGHNIGGHSMHHDWLVKLPLDIAKKDITDSMAAVNRYKATNLFRYPYGDHNPQLDLFLKTLGLRRVFWAMDLFDYKPTPADIMLENFKKAIDPKGGIVLMHDTNPKTTLLLPALIDYLRSQGFVLELYK